MLGDLFFQITATEYRKSQIKINKHKYFYGPEDDSSQTAQIEMSRMLKLWLTRV